MLERTTMNDLIEWKQTKTRQGLLVCGARQVGKTTLVHSFGRSEYAHFAELDFTSRPAAVETLAAAGSADDFLLRLSVLVEGDFAEGDSLVFLDEVQEFPDVITWLKYLCADGRRDFVLSGSTLGIDTASVRSWPVGFVREVVMRPLGFFEFCSAAGLDQGVLDVVRECLDTLSAVPDFIHERLMELFYTYLLVGGMPDAADTFVNSSDMKRVRAVQHDVVDAYGHDISKYVGSAVERRHVKTVFEAIPGQLAAKNKRFKFTKLDSSSRFAHMQTAFDWLTGAGVALSVPRVTEPLSPLAERADISSFKLFMSDVGLLTSQLMGDVDVEILNRRAQMNFGSIFENAVAQELVWAGRRPCYYNTSGTGEVDFLFDDASGDVTLIEVKSGKDYKRHQALSKFLATRNYSFGRVCVLHDGNVEVVGGVEYLPVYMAALL